MKTPPASVVLTALLLAASANFASSAQPAVTPSRIAAPLGLPRLQTTSLPGQAPALAAGRYALEELSAGAAPGVSKTRRDDCDVLALDAGSEWSRPLRGSGRDVLFVSFQLYASASTIVDIAGVRLGFTLSPAGRSLQLMYDDSATGALQWKPLSVHVGSGSFGGRTLAALPTLTVRLDPLTNTWDLFSGSRLIADHLPLILARNSRWQFTVRAGPTGAWLTGLVLADESPLYTDANANGVDDVFEQQRRGGLLPATASVVERRALAQAWRETQRQVPPPALYVNRPAVDRIAVKPPVS